MDFKIVYYKDSSGGDPIHEFLIELAKSNPDLLLHNTEQLAARSQYSVTRTFVKRYPAAELRGSSFTQVTKGIEKLRNRAYHKEPLSKHVEPGLWELRVRAGSDILRIMYTFAKGQVIILLHTFVKKQQKTPTSELEIARKRLRYLKEREII